MFRMLRRYASIKNTPKAPSNRATQPSEIRLCMTTTDSLRIELTLLGQAGPEPEPAYGVLVRQVALHVRARSGDGDGERISQDHIPSVHSDGCSGFIYPLVPFEDIGIPGTSNAVL